MINKYIQCLGLPGSSKTTYIDKHYNAYYNLCSTYMQSTIQNFSEFIQSKKVINANVTDKYVIVSADIIKTRLEGYNPDNPEYVHEKSVQLARQMIFDLAEDPNMTYNVILDGGGINNHYNISIIDRIRYTNPDADITTLFFDTPIDVCLKRISGRERKVPVEDIYRKNQKLIKCINKYIEISNVFIRIDYFTNKYILLDMDGTIAAYGKSKIDEDGNTDFVNCERFKCVPPVKHIIDFIKEHFDMNNVYIVTACPNSIAWQEKLEWLNRHFPEIPEANRMFVGNKHYKDVFIKHLAILKKWDLKDITIIDDFHETLQKCTAMGINAIHPSNVEVMFNPKTYQA